MAISIAKAAAKGNDSWPAPGRKENIYTWFFIFLFFFSFILAGEGLAPPPYKESFTAFDGFRPGKLCFFCALLQDINKKGGVSAAVKFKHFSIKDGLSQSHVNCIFQDNKGFMWFGTRDGLNKYDGCTFTVYKPIPGDRESLSDNFITGICQDNRGTIWIAAASGGLNRFDRQKNKFTRYTHDKKDPATISSNNLNSVSVDKDGTLWIGTKDAGLNQLNTLTGKIKRYIHIPGEPAGISCNNVQVTFMDKSGVLWIGTGSGGLNRLSKNGGFLVYKNDSRDPLSLGDNNVRAIYEDSSGNLWIGTQNGGLNKFDRKKENFSRFLKDDSDPFSISSNHVTAICGDPSGNTWIATDNGINQFLPRTGKFTCYRQEYFNPHSITANRVLCVYKDFSGALWFGTVKGIERYDKGNDKFSNVIEHFNSRGFKVDSFVWSVVEDRPGVLWIGTDSGGLYNYDRENNTVRNFKHDPGNPASLSDNSVRALLADKSGTLWVGTGNGLNKYNSRTGTFTRYKIDSRAKNYPPGNHFSVIYEDSKGDLWLGSMGGGLLKFDRENERFTVYTNRPGDKTSLGNNYIRSILEDRRGTLRIGTHGGLDILDGIKNSFSHYKHDPDNPGSLSHNHVHAIYEDKNGVLWLGTSWGLNRFDLKAGTFTRYFEEDGLAGNVICGILENPSRRLWISTNRGLSMLNTVSETFKNYDVNDGLQSNEFNIGACFRSRSGELFFGGINGLNGFYPGHVKENNTIPPVVITGFNVPGSFNGDVDITGKIILSPDQDSFSVEYAALDYTNPGKNKYAYKMEGFDENWINAGTGRLAAYTGLKPGEYVFRVKGSNNGNTRDESVASLTVIIRPSWWRTPLAYLFYGIVLVLAFVVFYRWQRQYIIKRERERSVIRETQRRAKEAEFQVSVAKARTREINEESKRKSLELEEARKFQLSMLPKRIPKLPHLEIAVSMKTASEVGGDYYDFMVAKGGALFVVCGDATGHGFKAGTMVSVIKTLFVANVLDPAEDFNRFFNDCTGTIKKVGVSNLHMALTMLKIDNYECSISSAGMPPVFISRKESNIVETILLKGPPLGAIKKFTYHHDYVHMEPGDTILLLTDGLPELFNREKEMFGYDRVRECFKELGEEGPGEIVSCLNKRAEKWLNYKPQDDDMTFVVIKFK
jgi:ligand-binding sensor domain-containing protein/serine phosphatase RsbU (regulator of sigma subunit)